VTNSSILIFGNSQAGALIQASKIVLNNDSVYWLATPSTLPRFHGSILSGQKNKLVSNIAGECNVSQFDVFIFSAFGSGSPRDKRWNHPIFEICARPTSDAMLKRLILSHTAAIRNLLQSLTKSGIEDVLCQPWPRPTFEALSNHDSLDLEHAWQHFCAVETYVLEEFCIQNGISLLKYPSGTEIFTPHELVTTNDPFHVNPSYGEKILQQVTKALKP
jgi:hypothetical protein